MHEHFYGQLTLEPAETDKLRKHGYSLTGLFMSHKLSEVEFVDEQEGEWVEWKTEDTGLVERQSRIFHDEVAAILRLPDRLICPTCGPLSTAVLDIDIILTKVYFQQKDGSWRWEINREHPENPNYLVRCASCGLEFGGEEIDSLDIQQILREAGSGEV